MNASGPVPWGDFSADPREQANASLRASDRDRDIVLGVLAAAYADGRLDREEYDERADVTNRAKTLGELPGVVADLVPRTPSRGLAAIRPGSPEELHERAVRAYEASRRKALSGLLTTTLVLTAIWLVIGGGFYWPAFVIAFGVANLIRVMLHKQDMVEEEERRLERRERRRLDPPEGR